MSEPQNPLDGLIVALRRRELLSTCAVLRGISLTITQLSAAALEESSLPSDDYRRGMAAGFELVADAIREGTRQLEREAAV